MVIELCKLKSDLPKRPMGSIEIKLNFKSGGGTEWQRQIRWSTNMSKEMRI